MTHPAAHTLRPPSALPALLSPSPLPSPGRFPLSPQAPLPSPSGSAPADWPSRSTPRSSADTPHTLPLSPQASSPPAPRTSRAPAAALHPLLSPPRSTPSTASPPSHSASATPTASDLVLQRSLPTVSPNALPSSESSHCHSSTAHN